MLVLHDHFASTTGELYSPLARRKEGRGSSEAYHSWSWYRSNDISLKSRDNDFSWAAVLGAAAVGAEELADEDDGVVLGGTCSLTVGLNDLILRILSTASLDEDSPMPRRVMASVSVFC